MDGRTATKSGHEIPRERCFGERNSLSGWLPTPAKLWPRIQEDVRPVPKCPDEATVNQALAIEKWRIKLCIVGIGYVIPFDIKDVCLFDISGFQNNQL